MNHVAAFVLRVAAESALVASRLRENRGMNPHLLCLMFYLRDAADAYDACPSDKR